MERSPVLDRPFESFRVGEQASLVRVVTEEDLEAFARLSGDHNPLHIDDGYAEATEYGRRVAHGWLVAAPISALAGHLLPGRRGLLLGARLSFVRPVFPGDRLTYQATVTHVSEATKVVKVQVDVTNQDGAVVLRGAYEGRVR